MFTQGTQTNNAALVGRVFELASAYLEGEPGQWDEAVPGIFTADFELVPASALASGTAAPYVGHEGARRWLRDIAAYWESFRINMDRLIDAPPDRVVALGFVSGRGTGSRGYAASAAAVCTIRGTKVAAMRSYDDQAYAMAAADAAGHR